MESPNQGTGITDSMRTCLKVQTELQNIGKSLQCPLCLYTLQSPTLLPCNHAFCKKCILANFDPVNNRTISASSGKATYKNQCPICKINCNKRGMNESDHLGDIVRAYKKTLRSFGLIPVAYDDKEGIAMTQIEESFDYDNPSEDDASKEKAKAPSLNQCYEHLEVARGMRDQLQLAVKTMEADLDSANDSSHQNKAKESEKRNEMKKYQFLLEDQNKVVKADNRFLLEAAVKKQKRNSKSTETAKVAFAQDLEGSEIPTETSGNISLGQKSDDSVDSEKSNCQLCSQNEIEEEHNDDDDDDDMGEQVIENTQHRVSRALNAIQMSDFALSEIPESQNQESQEFYSLDQGLGARNLSQGDIIMTTQDMMDEVREKEAADRSGEWHEKEVELEEQLNNRLQENTEDKISADGSTADKKSSAVSSALEATTNGRHKASSQLSERFFTAESQQEDQEKEENSVTQNKNTCTFEKGTIVIVADRTWPGVNKIGGVAKVQRVHTSEAGVKYDVAYVLGGREKLVDSAFVKLHIEDSGSFISETKKTESSSTKGVTSSTIGTESRTRKSRRVDERKMVEQWVAMIDAKEEKNEKKNKSKPKEETIQMKPKQKESTAKRKLEEDDKNNTSDNAEQKSRSKRKRVARSTKISVNNSIESSTIKETSPVVEKMADKSQSQEIPESNNPCTFQEVSDAALKKYQPILETGGSKKKIFITTSSLSNKESKIVKEMVRQFSKTNVPVKLLQDFNPYKTSVLITPSQSSFGEKRADMRTMKAMRAALNGIPIIDPSWCQSCIKEDKLLFDRAHCISSLPTKVPIYSSNVANVSEVLELPRDFPTASYGVFAAATSTKPLFGNQLFYLAGNEWKSNTTMTKDVKLIIVEGGGGILTSVQQVTKAIERDLDDERSSIVILCDGSQTDSTSGITKPLSKVISNAVKSSSKASSVTVVNSKWIFDCISCARLLEHDHYPPDSPSAKKMWRLQDESTGGDQMEDV